MLLLQRLIIVILIQLITIFNDIRSHSSQSKLPGAIRSLGPYLAAGVNSGRTATALSSRKGAGSLGGFPCLVTCGDVFPGCQSCVSKCKSLPGKVVHIFDPTQEAELGRSP